MKNTFLSFLCFLGLTSCNGQKLSQEEKNITTEIGLPEDIALKIKQNSTSDFEISKGYPDSCLLYTSRCV